MQKQEIHSEIVSRVVCDICGNEIMHYECGINRKVLYNGVDFCVSIVPMGRVHDLCAECCEKILNMAKTGECSY